MQKKEAMDERHTRAEKLRESHIQGIIKKAQEEDVKVQYMYMYTVMREIEGGKYKWLYIPGGGDSLH